MLISLSVQVAPPGHQREGQQRDCHRGLRPPADAPAAERRRRRRRRLHFRCGPPGAADRRRHLLPRGPAAPEPGAGTGGRLRPVLQARPGLRPAPPRGAAGRRQPGSLQGNIGGRTAQ